MISNDAAWDAVCRRSKEAEGAFVYAVLTTGIYCKPSCAARRPRRENVRFFDSPSAAESEGYRACRRCRPNAVQESLATRARRILDEAEQPITLRTLAGLLGVSPFHLQRTFKSEFGVSPKAYASARRAERLRSELRGRRTVTDAMYQAGYESAGALYVDARARLGMSPGEYRRGGEGVAIRFATRKTAMGWMLAAATRRGLCSVALGDSEPGLELALRAEFTRAQIERGEDALLASALDAIAGHVEQGRPLASLPLDIRATAFEIAVWNELRSIPRGETRRYTEVAQAIGRPAAVRAVANACAHNRMAIVIPCHRVVRSDGALGGYRWGIERKRELLAREEA